LPSRLSDFKLVYLDSILIVSVIIVVVESEINFRLRTGDDLFDERKIIVVVVEIRHFCLLRGIGRVIERERLTDRRKILKSTVTHSARYIHRRIVKASDIAARYNI
jgi:hypothetical protein